MAGIYIHVPFCKTRCNYCDFFTRTNQSQKSPYINALCKEIDIRADYLGEEIIHTIYFGGGTPSLLSHTELQSVLNAIKARFKISDDTEITLEANPDDLTKSYLSGLISLGFNRLSMGIQSFDDKLLTFLNRRHSANKAIESVNMAKTCGFRNISIDLMYGLPGQTLPIWEESLEKAIDLNIQHISSYHLIYEEGTKLYRLLKKGELIPTPEDTSLAMFSTMIDKLENAGFIHYEISNFGKDSYFSRHNSSYWLDEKYLGIGPASHSYNKENRSWNISSIPQYIEGIQSGIPNLDKEILDEKSSYNDFILTGMRTMWGIKKSELEKRFSRNKILYFEKNIRKHLESETVIFVKGTYKLTRKGIFISDSIMSDLMYIG